MSKTTTKRAILMSMLSLILCVSMLIGTTYAWFTDTVTSGNNIISSGTLDVEMSYAETIDVPAADSADWKDASKGAIFAYDLWEPGYVQVRHISIANVGTLALKYQIRIVINGELEVNDEGHSLADAIDVYYADPAKKATDRTLEGFENLGSLANALAGISDVSNTASGVLYPAGTAGKSSEDTVTIALKMREEAGNEYQGMALGASFSIQLLATQYTYEEDSFDDQYDALADDADYNFPAVVDFASATVVDGEPTTITTGLGSATVPFGATNADTGDTLTLYIEKTDTPEAFTAETAGNGTTTYEVTLKNQEGAVVSSDEGIKITLNIGTVDLFNFYHNNTALTAAASAAAVDELNEYYYDVTKGVVTFITDSFSPFTAEYAFAGGLGTEAFPYLIATDRQLKNVNNKSKTGHWYSEDYFKMIADITVASSLYQDAFGSDYYGVIRFYDGGATFDGNGHTVTISNGQGCFVGTFENNSKIKNLNLVLNGKDMCFAHFAKNVTISGVTIDGHIEYDSSNRAVFIERAYCERSKVEFTFENCTNNADVAINGGTDLYNAVFIGHLGVGGTTCVPVVTFNNCTNSGNITGQKVAMFIANPNAYTVDVRIENCKNTGVIMALNTTYFANYYYATPSNCYTAYKINNQPYKIQGSGVTQVPSPEEDTLVANTGMFIQNQEDATLALEENANHTFTITPASNPSVVKYIVYVGTSTTYYTETGATNGSGRNYVTEEIAAENVTAETTIKNLSFVDLQWVESNSSAVESFLGEYKIYTLDGISYYLLNNPHSVGVQGEGTGGIPRAAQMVSVVGFDSNGKAVCSASLS